MKMLIAVAAAIAFSALFFSNFAVSSMNPLPTEMVAGQTGALHPAGTVSVSGARNLDDLTSKLAKKAQDQGAKSFVITSARGDEYISGNAILYK